MKTIKQKAIKRLTPKTDSLTREQRRRLEREKVSGEATYTLTRAQIEKIRTMQPNGHYAKHSA